MKKKTAETLNKNQHNMSQPKGLVTNHLSPGQKVSLGFLGRQILQSRERVASYLAWRDEQPAGDVPEILDDLVVGYIDLIEQSVKTVDSFVSDEA